MDAPMDDTKGIDPGLNTVIDAWAGLPESIRRAIELLVLSRLRRIQGAAQESRKKDWGRR
jgi:hypothetical protein